MCGMLNDVPSSYFSQLDSNNQRRDKMKRPELSKCSVEFVAPGDYMVRPSATRLLLLYRCKRIQCAEWHVENGV